MRPHTQTLAIVLGYRPFRESDRVYRVLSPHQGKLEVLARGSRKTTSKLAGGLEPVRVVMLHMVAGRQYPHAIAAGPVELFPGAVADPGRRLFALTLLAFVDALLKPQGDERGIFALLLEALRVCERTGEREERLIIRDRFIWKCAALLGVLPLFDRCDTCGRLAAEGEAGRTWSLRLAEGGLCCYACPRAADGVPLSSAAVRDVAAALGAPLAQSLPETHPGALLQARSALSQYALAQLGGMMDPEIVVRLFADALPERARFS